MKALEKKGLVQLFCQKGVISFPLLGVLRSSYLPVLFYVMQQLKICQQNVSCGRNSEIPGLGMTIHWKM